MVGQLRRFFRNLGAIFFCSAPARAKPCASTTGRASLAASVFGDLHLQQVAGRSDILLRVGFNVRETEIQQRSSRFLISFSSGFLSTFELCKETRFFAGGSEGAGLFVV